MYKLAKHGLNYIFSIRIQLFAVLFAFTPLFILLCVFYFQLTPAEVHVVQEIEVVSRTDLGTNKTDSSGLFGWLHSSKGSSLQSFLFRLCPFYSETRAQEIAQLVAEKRKLAELKTLQEMALISGMLDESSISANYEAVVSYTTDYIFLASVVILFIMYVPMLIISVIEKPIL